MSRVTPTAWATVPFPNGLTYRLQKGNCKTITEQRKVAAQAEKAWGNKVIGQEKKGNWAAILGENLVYDTLAWRGENPRKPERKGGYQPDWETDNYIYEVKTRCWTVSGTAGEKVLGVMYKYSDIPLLYGKPLRIVCVGYQEWELTNGNTKIFGEVGERKRKILDFAKSMDIEYIKFSELSRGDC